MNEHERIKRAEQAIQLLRNPLWEECFATFRQRQIDAIERADPEDVDAVLRAKRMLAVVQDVKAQLEMIVKDGSVSSAIVQQQETRKKWYSINS